MKSKCCNAKLDIAGSHDMEIVCTQYYVCSKCRHACDPIHLTNPGKDKMSISDDAIEYVLGNEGLLEVNENDPGGITKFGVSLRFMKSLTTDELKKIDIYDEVTDDTIRNMDKNLAVKIYKIFFWDIAPFYRIANQLHCNYIFDMSVDQGLAPAIKCVQHAIWAVSKQNLLAADGILGDKTIAGIKLCGFMLMPALRAERANYYRSLDKKEFIEGWLRRTYRS